MSLQKQGYLSSRTLGLSSACALVHDNHGTFARKTLRNCIIIIYENAIKPSHSPCMVEHGPLHHSRTEHTPVTLYYNRQTNAPIGTLECVATEGKHSREVMTFYYLNDETHAPEAKALLARSLPRQTLVGETTVGGRLVLITRGHESPNDILSQLHGASQDFAKALPPKKFNPWKWRGMMSNVGQSLQVVSAAFKNKQGFDSSVLGFALFNLAANMINVVFGAEKRPDVHRLRYLKAEFNEQIAPFVDEAASLPDPAATQTKDRTNEKRETIGDKATGFLRRNSVTFGEIGLRYVGSLNLAFPFTRIFREAPKAFQAAEGSFGTKLLAGVNAAKNKEGLLFAAGMGWLIGKTIGLGSKSPDPYDPKPHTTLDTIREKYLFKISTTFEILGAGTLMATAFKPGKVTAENPDGVKLFTRERNYWVPEALKHEKFIQRDWFGAVGGLFFTTGLSTRYLAPFGTREVDMKELYAHIATGLAKAPADKLPQLLADSALAIKAQFPDQPLEFGDIYASLAHELERYHHITILKPHASLRLVTAVSPEHKPPAPPSSPDQPSNKIDAASAHATHASTLRGASI